jgi:hypothetical protein
MELRNLTQDRKEQILVDAESVIARMRAVQLEVLDDFDQAQIATADGSRSLSEWTASRVDLSPEKSEEPGPDQTAYCRPARPASGVGCG